MRGVGRNAARPCGKKQQQQAGRRRKTMGNAQGGAKPGKCGYRVLGVQPNSPASKVGLVSFFDFIVAADGEYGGVVLGTNTQDLFVILGCSSRRLAGFCGTFGWHTKVSCVVGRRGSRAVVARTSTSGLTLAPTPSPVCPRSPNTPRLGMQEGELGPHTHARFCRVSPPKVDARNC